jgi:hypothetical protein
VGAAAAADAQTKIDIAGVSYTAMGAKGVTKVKAGAADAVTVKGAGATVKLDCCAAVTGKGAGQALSTLGLGIQHFDKGPHTFAIALAVGGSSAGSVSILCDEKPSASIGIGCSGKPAANLLIACKGTPATIKPAFAGVATYSLEVMKNGKLVRSLQGQAGEFTIGDFDDGHHGVEETLGFVASYGTKRAGAWTLTLTHGAYTIVITAEGNQKLAPGGALLSVTTTGLEEVTLTGQKVATQAAP